MTNIARSAARRCRSFARTRPSSTAGRKPVDEDVWKRIEPDISYVQGDYGSEADHAQLGEALPKIDEKAGRRAIASSTSPRRPTRLSRSSSASASSSLPRRDRKRASWQRIIIEKPFGRDLASARLSTSCCTRYFAEEQVFRIDHYLGKETVQNLMVMRFANSIFEPIWNYKYIDHVQITVSETLGVGTRGGYYDKSGALRDMVQNHLFQLMALVAMEPPAALDAVSIRDEKVKVYKSVRPFRPDHVADFTVRGQYAAGEAPMDRKDRRLS